jgi:septal ring factor EnvC (AmiA/AmiB activator)
MKTDVFQTKKAASSTDPLPLEIDPAEIALRQADVARLFGITRQRVSQLVSRGQLTTRPDGRINPSTAAAELLKSDAPQARSKILVRIRRQIERAESERDQAQAIAAKASRSLATLRGHIVTVTRKLMEAERRIDVLIEEIELMLDDETRDDELMDALGRAFTRVAASSDAVLFERLIESDEALADLVADLRPDLCETIAELESEPLPLLADLDEPPALEIEP